MVPWFRTKSSNAKTIFLIELNSINEQNLLNKKLALHFRFNILYGAIEKKPATGNHELHF